MPNFGSTGSTGRALLGLGVAAALAVAAGCTGGSAAPQRQAVERMPAGPACIKNTKGECLTLGRPERRVDLIKPRFSRPTSITNPMHATSVIEQTLYGGHVEGRPFRTEVTLLPDIKNVTWDGKAIRTVTQQYVAYLDGRIAEVALDYFGQADDGAVWYFGEDVYNYEDGVVADNEGTWLAGRGGAPPAMIMPARPRIGDIYRPENLPGVVFEEVRVKAVGQTVPGPSGPIKGAMTVQETHVDGALEDKTFAPGYGEFSTGTPKGDLEAAVLAVPADRRPGPPPAPLTLVSSTASAIFDRAARGDWATVSAATAKVRRSWAAYRSGGVFPLHAVEVDRALKKLSAAISNRDARRARQAAIDIAQTALALRLRHRPPLEIDKARLDLWVWQLVVDAGAKDAAGVAGDAATLG